MQFLIANDIPSPWREPVFERVHRSFGGDVRVVYFKENEKRRLWTFAMGDYPKTILPGWTVTTRGTERFLNPGIVPLLWRERPKAAMIIANIKDPTALLALATCRCLRIPVALLDDSWHGRDRDINGLQRKARSVFYNAFGEAFIGASRQTLAMFRTYNPRIRDEQCFLSHLVADNEYFERRLAGRCPVRDFDLLFAGRIVAVKNPGFFARVCAGVKQRRGRCRVLIMGEGEASLKAEMRAIFDEAGVEYGFAGFIPHADLPDYYARARLLLLPTSGDCWGVVLNEAMVAGTPVLTTDLTAAAGELVLHEDNGCILPLELRAWVEAAVRLLDDGERWEAFSRRARARVAEFDFDRAAQGIVDALRFLSSRA